MPRANVAAPMPKSLMTDCTHEHSLQIGSYKIDKPEDKAHFRKLLDDKKEDWDVDVHIFLCSDCKRQHAHMVMDL